ncbi:response regulator [Candidatus Chlorohelix sp.]|uniref:response regulator n=1 Tax=Candidatus Chlorohelix sp. TaxID=3139201 RepID=UPI0030369A75
MVVLVVNETPALRKVVRTFCELQGYDVVEASHSGEAYSQAIEYKPQIVVMDNIIDSSHCIGVCKNIQAIPGLETTEFLIFTDFENEIVDTSGIQLKGVISKPNIVPKLRSYFPTLK